jgi:hypothetical protein
MDISPTVRRVILGLAVLIVVLGVGAALLLPPRELGPCSIATEFRCGSQPSTTLRWLLGVGAGGLSVSLVVWAQPRPRSE